MILLLLLMLSLFGSQEKAPEGAFAYAYLPNVGRRKKSLLLLLPLLLTTASCFIYFLKIVFVWEIVFEKQLFPLKLKAS